MSPSAHELADDSKDVLVQRLNDLAVRLASEETLNDEDVSALHVDIDRMERVLKRTTHGENHSPLSPLRLTFNRLSGSPGAHHDDEAFWSVFSPSPTASPQAPGSPSKLSRPKLQKAIEFSTVPKHKKPSKVITVVAKEADFLHAQLSGAVQELKARKEEVDHIHGLLVTRSENAAQRILHLENQLKNLQDDHTTLLSNLSYLRIQLRALEVRGDQYIPYNADAELAESIRNWKLEWADVDMKTRRAKKKCTEILQAGIETTDSNRPSRSPQP
ncbi:MAG: hypothetical protein M1818_005397 [Claussenomyces sp. TS43310]|nr:MAG: hypothetical protein M1818_005397 [Claussenomyces sp. TS43310]